MGSSISSSGGSTASARAIATRWASPPELAREARAVTDTELVEQSLCTPLGLRPRHAMDVHGCEPDVVNRGEVLEKKVELEHHPHFPFEGSSRPPARRQTLSFDAIDEDGAIVEPLEARDCPEDRGFTGSRQAHEGEHFAGRRRYRRRRVSRALLA